MPIRVRFAPSPTGFLHVGGARTAIFNWLYARNKGGKFLLRIEDTDSERSKSELSRQIIRSMNWLGIYADEPVIYQSDHISRHREIVSQLIDSGKAYYAFESQEELSEKRKEAESDSKQYNYDRTSLKYSARQVKQFLAEGKSYAIRFKVPDGKTEFEDMVHGKTIFNNSEIDDFVLLRSDGSPTYQIAVVVDDHDMKISHIIRGDDHLSNTPKQIMLYEAMGWDIPVFAHLPLIHDENKKKLSKRRNTVAVEDYKTNGYLPEALFNFLTLLGFAPPDNNEILSRDELAGMFSFERVNKKSSVFDTKKLNWLNFEYIKNSEDKYLLELVKEMIKMKYAAIPNDSYLSNLIILMKPRVERINDFYDKCIYFYADPEQYDEKGISKYWNDDIKKVFVEYFEELKKVNENFNAAYLEESLRGFSENNKIKAGSIIHIIRIALTGSTASPGIFELMEILGKESVYSRIEKFLKKYL
jgi:glutamyl-tRNA synthetase